MEQFSWAHIIPVALALAGAVWLLIRSKIDRTESRLDHHIGEDIEAHERLKGVETEVTNLKVEVGKLRDMRHDIIEQVTQSLASWYQRVVEMISKK